MARISQDEIDNIRAHADIVDVISHYIQVHRKGKSYVALCPFHDDHDPSMSISPDRQIYKCFVCGNGGNVFTFVQNYEKISFPEAVARVAELTGQHLSVDVSHAEVKEDPHKEALHKVLQETINYTMYQLDTPEAMRQKQYLEQRGLNDKVRQVFQIGYNPPGSALSDFLRKKGYAQKDMVQANVSVVNERGMYDVFSDRITFPIHDIHGHPIGFSARTLDPDNASKYINTNETDVFIKGDIVYNYHRARADARREGKIYVCEGVTDVIAFYRAGITNAVCTLGTSCTENQIRQLRTIAARVVFCYDGDHAGQAATMRAVQMAVKAGCDTAVISNKTGKDPDEIVSQDGAEAFQNLLKNEISWIEFALSYLKSQTNMDSYLDKKEMVAKAEKLIAMLPDQMDRQYFTDQLSKETGFQIKNITQEQLEPVSPVTRHKLTVPDGTKNAEMQILSMMMKSAEASRKFEEQLGYLISEDGQALSMLIVDAWHSRGKADPNLLIDETTQQPVRDLITSIASSESYSEPYDEKKFEGAMRRIRIEALNDEAEQYKEQLTAALNGTSMELLMKKYNECLTEKRRLINEEN